MIVCLEHLFSMHIYLRWTATISYGTDCKFYNVNQTPSCYSSTAAHPICRGEISNCSPLANVRPALLTIQLGAEARLWHWD